MKSTTTCIIPARGGSQRIPKKNQRHFFGRPIITYAINTALNSHLFDRVIVSTDDPIIAQIATTQGATLHLRTETMAHDNIGTQAVARHVINDMQIDTPLICVLYATTPMVIADDLRRAFGLLKSDLTIDYIVPIGQWLQDPGQWYFGRLDAFLSGVPLADLGTRLLPIPQNRAIDINTFADWDIVRKNYRNLFLDQRENSYEHQ